MHYLPSPRRSFLALALVLLAGGVAASSMLGGCARLDREQEVAITRESGAEQFGEKGESVAIEGSDAAVNWSLLALDIDNQRGSVTIEASPEYLVPAVWAGVVVEAGEKGVTDAGAWERDFVTAAVVVQSGRPILRIISSSPGNAQAKFTNLRVRVPACAGLRLRNSDGRVEAKGIGGSIDVDNNTSTAWAGNWGGTRIIAGSPIVDSVTIKTGRGGLDLRLPAGSTGRLHARVVKGRLLMDLDRANIIDARTTGKEYYATIEGGTNPIVLTANEGTVTIMYDRR